MQHSASSDPEVRSRYQRKPWPGLQKGEPNGTGTLTRSGTNETRLLRIVEICTVRHRGAFTRHGRLLVGDAGLSRFGIERQDGVIFDKRHESLRLPGTPQQAQQHDGCKNLHWNPLSGRPTDTSTPLVDCENAFQGMALWGSRAPRRRSTQKAGTRGHFQPGVSTSQFPLSNPSASATPGC